MLRLPPDHPDRFVAANEVHTRPYDALDAPGRASHLAMLVDPAEREAERAHLNLLCQRFGVAPLAEGLAQFSLPFGRFRLKWERHGEFSTWTVFVPGLAATPFEEPALSLLPAEWVEAIPGRAIVAAHACVMSADLRPDGLPADALEDCFGTGPVVGAFIGDGAGLAYTDFKIQHDGCVRFLLVDGSLTPFQAGRMLQRLFEIETYRVLALLGMPVARQEAPRVLAIEAALTRLTHELAGDSRDDEALLDELTRLAAQVESTIATSQFRFGASRAYYELVRSRIAELREQRIEGLQTVSEFVARRVAPAMATCESLWRRLSDLSERIARASNLLSTRVDIVREKQNQSLLASMDRRARLQLRLQAAVEGLSVVAITYYVVGLVDYVVHGLGDRLPVAPDRATGLSVPVVAVLVILLLRYVRRRITRHPASAGHGTGLVD